MALLNGRRVPDLSLTVLPAGGWFASGHLEDGEPIAAGAATLRVNDLDLVGVVTADRGGDDAPARPAFVLQGGAGWKRAIPAPGGSYASAAGVRLTTVLRNLAKLAGEPYLEPAEKNLGPSYGWDASTPERPIDLGAVLADLVARRAVPLWRVAVGARDVAPNGQTVFAAWPSLGAADDHGVIIDRKLARGVREVKPTDSVAAWLPGATVQGVRIARVWFSEHGGELYARISDA